MSNRTATNVWSDRVGDGFVAGFAAWTLVSNAILLTGGGVRQLLLGAGALAVVLGAAALIRRARVGSEAGVDGLAAHPEAPPAWQRVGVAVWGLAAAAACLDADTRTLGWGAGLALVGVLSLRELRWPPASEPPREDPGWHRGLLGLCIAFSILVLCVHRAIPDDAFYGNFILTASQDWGMPLMRFDTLHGIPEVPVVPVYRLHALETLEALVATLPFLEALDVLYLVVPPLLAFLVPLAHATLFRRLTPDRWIFSTVVTLLFYVCVAGPILGHSNLAIPHMHQGKTVFLLVLLPLVVARGIDFGRTPTWRGWLRLVLVQIASLGMTSSAIWCAPAAAGIAVACGLRFRSGRLRTLPWALSSSFYLIGAGLALRGAVSAVVSDVGGPRLGLGAFDTAFELGLGSGASGALALAAMFASWAVAPTALARRFAVFFSAALLLLFWNPFSAEWVASNLVGRPTYTRVFWLLPLPVLVGIGFTAPWSRLAGVLQPWQRGAACVGLAVAALVALPGPCALGTANNAPLDWPRWKPAPDALAAARSVVAHASPGDRVLAPEAVAPWIVTLPDHPHPLVVQVGYLEGLAERLGREEIGRRQRLFWMVTGLARAPELPEELRTALREDPLTVVCLDAGAAAWRPLRAVLHFEGLRPVHEEGRFEVWARTGAAPDHSSR